MNNSIVLKVQYLENYNRKLYGDLNYSHIGDAGWDLRACIPERITLHSHNRVLIPNGIKIDIPDNYQLEIRSRSGLCLKHGILVLNSPGTVDSGFKNEINTLLMNLGDEYFTINPGDRISQCVFMSYVQAHFVTVNELSTSERNLNGFGSTGVK